MTFSFIVIGLCWHFSVRKYQDKVVSLHILVPCVCVCVCLFVCLFVCLYLGGGIALHTFLTSAVDEY